MCWPPVEILLLGTRKGYPYGMRRAGGSQGVGMMSRGTGWGVVRW